MVEPVEAQLSLKDVVVQYCDVITCRSARGNDEVLLSYWKLLTYGFWRRMRRLFGMCAQRNAHDAVYDARSPFHSFHVIWRSSIDTEVSSTDCGPYMGQESCASEGGGSEHKGTWIEVPGMCVFSDPCSAR